MTTAKQTPAQLLCRAKHLNNRAEKIEHILLLEINDNSESCKSSYKYLRYIVELLKMRLEAIEKALKEEI